MTSSENNLPRDEIRDEPRLFTIEEWEQAALLLRMPPDEAREWASHAHDYPQTALPHEFHHIPTDMLDVFTLVSESCADRVAMIWQVSPEEAAARRAAIRREYGLDR
jgi:hypothetical protein